MTTREDPEDGPGTAGEMLPEVYDELRKLARARLARERQPHQTLQPTALVHEAYLRVSGDDHARRWRCGASWSSAPATTSASSMAATRRASNWTAGSCGWTRR